MSYTDEQRAASSARAATAWPPRSRARARRGCWSGLCFLLEQGIPSECIRVLAFNKSAAREFKDRLAGALPAGFQAPKVSTFHSL